MTKEEEKTHKLEKLKSMKGYFVKSFWISFMLLLTSSLICIFYYDAQAQAVEKIFHIGSERYSELLVLMLGLWKILIVQFTLIPAIVLCIMTKQCKCGCDCD